MRVVLLFEQHPDVLAKLPGPLAAHPGRRVPGHQPRAVPALPPLAAKHRNLAVVGDDDQSIYSWRGADLRNILDFEHDYPDAKVVKLEQNYRSTQTILDAAHAVVSRNEGRKDKKLWTDRGAGTQITLFDAYNEYEEAEFVARQVERAGRRLGTRRADRLLTRRADDEDGALRYGEIAICYRINAQSRVLEEAFMRFGIPYQLVGGTRFYERREVKDALATCAWPATPPTAWRWSGSSTCRRGGSATRPWRSCAPGPRPRRQPVGGGRGRRREPEPGAARPHRAGRLRASSCAA